MRQTGKRRRAYLRVTVAVIWGLFKRHLCPSRCRTLSHAGAESGETRPLSSATVAGPKYLIAFLLLHAGLYRLLNGDTVPSPDPTANPTPSQQSGELKKRVGLKMGSWKTQSRESKHQDRQRISRSLPGNAMQQNLF